VLRLVGRDDETARLGVLLAGLASGPSALVVEGPPAGLPTRCRGGAERPGGARTLPGIMRGGGVGARPRPDRVRGSGSNSVEPVASTVGL
jgi:hypothetical protein